MKSRIKRLCLCLGGACERVQSTVAAVLLCISYCITRNGITLGRVAPAGPTSMLNKYRFIVYASSQVYESRGARSGHNLQKHLRSSRAPPPPKSPQAEAEAVSAASELEAETNATESNTTAVESNSTRPEGKDAATDADADIDADADTDTDANVDGDAR